MDDSKQSTILGKAMYILMFAVAYGIARVLWS